MNEKDLVLLQEYIDLEGTEIGDALATLMELYQSGLTDYLNDSFVIAIEDELDKQLNWFRDNFKIEEREESYTKTEKWRQLVEK